jgi:hypothetical protein
MTRPLRIVLVIGALFSQVPSALAGEAAPQSKPVLVQNLSDRVLWTRRPDRYTLQVLTGWRHVPVTSDSVQNPSATGKRQLPSIREVPNIEAWLLKKDGTSIPAFQRWQTPAASARLIESREPVAEVLFAYALSEGPEAVAVVVCTDGDCLVRKIVPFPQ